MSYEQFRNEMITQLLRRQPINVTMQVLATMDMVAAKFDFTPKCTTLTVSVDPVPQAVKAYLSSMAIEGLSSHTLYRYRLNLEKFFRIVRIAPENLTANDIRVYLYQYQQERGISNASLDGIRSSISTFLEWCVNEDIIDKNPAKMIKKIKYQPSKRTHMSQLELEIMRAACRTPRERALVEFLYSTGCRVSEACDMLLDDIDLEGQTVIVQHGKGDKRRVTYLTAASVVAIREYLATRTDPDRHLFVRERHYHTEIWSVKSKALEKTVARILLRTCIVTHVTPHTFRHTMATVAIRSGMPADQLQRLLGHAHISTTMIYAESDDSDVKRSHAKYIA